MANETNKGSLRGLIKGLLIADVIWATTLALLQSLVLNQIGYTFGANHVATNAASGLAFIPAFFIGLFTGAIFMLFGLIIGAGWAWLYSTLTKGESGAKVKGTINKLYGLVGICMLGWAGVMATLQAIVLNQAGAVAHANGFAVWTATVLTWFATFCIGLFQSAVFFTVIGGFCFVAIVLYATFSGKGKTNANTTGGASAPSDSDKK